MKQSVIIEAQGISVFHQTQCLQTILVNLNAHKVYKTINSQNYKLTLFLKYIWHVLCVSCIFLNCCGFNRPSDLRLVGFGVGSCCALSWKKQSLAVQCGCIWAFKSVFWLRQPSLPWMKKAWEIHTALRAGGSATLMCVPGGENHLVVWFLQGLISFQTGFGALWKLEPSLTVILLCVSFSFDKNNFIFIPLMLLKNVELIQWGRWEGRGSNKILYVITHLKKTRFSIYISQFSMYISGLLLSCKDAHEVV